MGRRQLPGLAQWAQQIDDALDALQTAAKQEQHPARMPAFETSLDIIRAHVHELSSRRVAALTGGAKETATREAIQDTVLVSREAERLADDVCIMHAALQRMWSLNRVHPSV